MWMVMAGPRVRVVMDMWVELGMVKVSVLYSEPIGMWMVMAGPRVMVVMDMWVELGIAKVSVL